MFRTARNLVVAACCLNAWMLVAASAHAAEDVIWIGLENSTEAEAVMAMELRQLLREYDLEPWILTRRILIDENRIPHSHPVLTIHTAHIGERNRLLSTFVHEQLHWLEDEPWLERFRAAMRDYEALFPEVPDASAGGARDRTSTYRHLLVCDLEYQALGTLIGEQAARETLSSFTHYAWVFETVLTDPRVREVALTHGFDVSSGIPKSR